MATTIVERDSHSVAGAFLIFILFAALIAAVVWFAATHDLFAPKTVIEHNKTVLVPPATPVPDVPKP